MIGDPFMSVGVLQGLGNFHGFLASELAGL
jgi:hypothetical protein